MKLLCNACERAMGYEGHDGLSEGRLAIRFRCEACCAVVSLVTNAGESMLVHSLGVRLGEAQSPPPLSVTRETLKQTAAADGIVWEEAAERRIERVPAPVRHMARQAIESFARGQGIDRITESILDDYRTQQGTTS